MAKLRPVPKAPEPLPAAEPNHWPGTLLGVLAIICAGSLTMACAGLLGGGFV